jgi:hypothetical protein
MAVKCRLHGAECPQWAVWSSARRAASSCRWFQPPETIPAVLGLQPGGRHLPAGGVNHREQFQQCLVFSPEGDIFLPVVSTTGNNSSSAWSSARRATSSCRWCQPPETIPAVLGLQPGGRHLPAGGVNHREQFQQGSQPRGRHRSSSARSLVSPSGLSESTGLSPVAYATGKEMPPSGLKCRPPG